MQRTKSAVTAALAALVVLCVFAAGASAAEPEAVISSPKTGEPLPVAHVGEPYAAAVTGEHLAKLEVSGEKPAWLEAEKVTEAEWKLKGTPSVVESLKAVTLTPKNAAEEAGAAVEVKLVVHEALPTVEAPAEASGTVGSPITPVHIKGTNVKTVELASGQHLPEGLTLSEEAGEWQIAGKPLSPVKAQAVTFIARDNVEEGVEFTITWTIVEALPAIGTPADQTGVAGKAITPVPIEGTNLATVTTSTAHPLPAGLSLTKTAGKWTITGTPTAAGTSTVELEAKNAEGKAGTPVTFKWTIAAAEEPPKPKSEVPSAPPSTPPAPTVASAGRLGTLPVQKQGRQLVASFLCEVQSCTVTIASIVTAGKKKFKVRSAATKIVQGKKVQIPLKLSKSQRNAILEALKKHKKVTAALSATIQSSIGYQVTKALTVTVKR